MSNTNTPTAATVRAWAKSRGIPVGARGKIPADVVARFNARRKPANRYAA